MKKQEKPPVAKRGFKKLPKWLRISIWTLGIIILLLILAVAGATWYINHNKQKILKYVSEEISDKTDGILTIQDMEATIWKNFPHFSLKLKKVKLVDSLYSQHQRAMFDIDYMYLQVNLSTILTPHPEIEKVTITDGKIYFFTDENGYSNLYMLKKKGPKKQKKKNKKQVEIKYVTLENIDFTSVDAPKTKKFNVVINSMPAVIDVNDGNWNIETPADIHIGQLGFKLTKGSFLENTDIKGDLSLNFNTKTKDFTIKKKPLIVNGEDVLFGGVFHFGQKPVTFSLLIDAPQIDFKKGRGMLNAHIQSKLKAVDVKDPVKVLATIDGRFMYPDTPTVHVNFSTVNNTVMTEYGNLDNASFEGLFNNEVVLGAGHSDHNSEIRLGILKASWQNIPIRADSVRVLDLLDPNLKFRLRSEFNVTEVNNLLSNSYHFSGGQAKMDLRYSGPVNAASKDAKSLNGSIVINNTTFTYVPRNLTFDKSNIHLDFVGEDLVFSNIKLTSKGNTINMNGTAKRFLNLYFDDPRKFLIDWNIQSNNINLNDFVAFLGKRSGSAPKPTKATVNSNVKIQQFNDRIQALLAQGSMNLNVNIRKMIYQKFEAEDIKAKLSLLESGIKINNFHVMHAGGALDLSGAIDQSKKTNPFDLKINVVNAKIDKLLDAFNNFGLSSLTSENIKGIISADVKLTGGITDQGKPLPDSYNGHVGFTLTDGALLNFEPLVKIQKFAFKKRNLDSVTLKPLRGDFNIANHKVTIDPMNIETSALNINVKGVYSFTNGTDINVEIPLRNPEKDKKRVLKGLEAKPKRGLVIYLRATDDESGKLKIAWDPLKKGWNGGNDADAALDEMDREDSMENVDGVSDTTKTIIKTDTSKPKKRFSIFGKKNKNKK